MTEHFLTWGDRGDGFHWQANCCGKSTIGNGGPYPTEEQAKSAARIICEGKRKDDQK